MKEILQALNAAFAADPNAIHALIVNRVPCNCILADDPFMQVDKAKVLEQPSYQVGAIGLVNGVLAAAGLPLIAVMFSEGTDAEGRHKILGFCEYKPSKEGE